MIVALLNQKGGVGKTTLATHIAGELALRGQNVILLDADPQGSSLDWTQRRSQQGLPRLFSAVGLARETLHQEAPELARRADHVIIDGPPRIAALARSALLAAERVLIPVQPSPYDLWASAEMMALIREAQMFRPQLTAAFIINRRVSTTVIGREARQALAEQPLPVLRAEVRQRIVFADSVADWHAKRRQTASPHVKSWRWWMNCCGGRYEQGAQQTRRHRCASSCQSTGGGMDSPRRRRRTQQGRSLHRPIDPRHHACHAGAHQGLSLHAGRDRGRVAACLAGTRVPGEPIMNTQFSATPAASPPPLATLPGQADSAPLTRVSLAYLESRFKLYLRFGEPVRIIRFDRWRRVAGFLPNAIFCRIRWQANDYGTVRWQLMVMQSGLPRDAMQRIPGVKPGARLLLHTQGDHRVRTMLERIDAIEAQDIAPATVPPAYWRTLANRLAARLPLPEYTAERHAAWLAGRALQ